MLTLLVVTASKFDTYLLTYQHYFT